MWSAYAGQRVYLDANAIIYAVEGQFVDGERARAFLTAIDEKVVVAVTSEITIAEVLVKPLETANRTTLAIYEEFFSSDSQIQLVPVGRDLIISAASISAFSKIKLPDAIHVATAQARQCQNFLTHDERLGRVLPDGVRWLRLLDQMP